MTQTEGSSFVEKYWLRITEKQLLEFLFYGKPIEAQTTFSKENISISRPWSDSFGLGYGNCFDHIITATAKFRDKNIKIKMHLSPASSGHIYIGYFTELEE